MGEKVQRLGVGVAHDVTVRIDGVDITIEELARARASLDGKLEAFDEGKGKSVFDDEAGHYAGYVVETEEIIRRAYGYAMKRARSQTQEG